MPKIEVEIIGPITETVETDPATLLQLLRRCHKGSTRLVERLQKSRARVKAMREFLLGSQRQHDHCDDSWYCCPKCQCEDHVGGPPPSVARFGDVCTCGAEAWNAKVKEVCN